MNDQPICGKCGEVMTPETATIHPEYFLHDRCLPVTEQEATEQNDAREALNAGGPHYVSWPPLYLKKVQRACNRHSDCDYADVQAREQGRIAAEHCHDSACPDCFGQ